ncbi:MFS transporter [Bradyrhizobium japonicum]
MSSGLVGFLFGAVGHGTVADRFGRRGTLLAGLWIVNVFTLLTAMLANDFWSYCALRFATGLGLGVLLPLGTTFINELAPKRVSNTFSLWGVTLGWSLGGVCAGLVGVFLTPQHGWQILDLHRCAVDPADFRGPCHPAREPAIPGHPVADPRAARAARTIAPGTGARLPECDVRFSRPRAPQSTIGALLTPRYRRVSLTIWITAFLSLFAIFGLTGWIPTVMLKRGETFAASFGFGALMQAMSFIGGLTLAMLADRNLH